MLKLVKSQKTKWEKIEELRNKKINAKTTLEKMLETAIEMQKEAL